MGEKGTARRLYDNTGFRRSVSCNTARNTIAGNVLGCTFHTTRYPRDCVGSIYIWHRTAICHCTIRGRDVFCPRHLDWCRDRQERPQRQRWYGDGEALLQVCATAWFVCEANSVCARQRWLRNCR